MLQSLGLGCGGAPAGQGEGGGSLVRLEGQNKTGGLFSTLHNCMTHYGMYVCMYVCVKATLVFSLARGCKMTARSKRCWR